MLRYCASERDSKIIILIRLINASRRSPLFVHLDE